VVDLQCLLDASEKKLHMIVRLTENPPYLIKFHDLVRVPAYEAIPILAAKHYPGKPAWKDTPDTAHIQ
jgi:hypothetical protein